MISTTASNDMGLINHIVLLVDNSTSMAGKERDVVKVVDGLISRLAQRSKEKDQETRATVYLFNTNIRCLFYDKDVLRLPSIAGLYKLEGATALIDATLKAISDLEKTATLYGDHAFLIYVITDGEENSSNQGPAVLSSRIRNLPVEWTLAALVPDQTGVAEAKSFGFLPGNIDKWSTTSPTGVVEVGEKVFQSTDSFMQARATGVRGTTNLFQLDASDITPKDVQSNLNRVPKGQYVTLAVPSNAPKTFPIKSFVERQTGTYNQGSAFYRLTKREEIQPQKQIVLRDKYSGELYTGPEARRMLGLPDFTVKVAPAGQSDRYDIFVQSTSVNRNLVGGTSVLVL